MLVLTDFTVTSGETCPTVTFKRHIAERDAGTLVCTRHISTRPFIRCGRGCIRFLSYCGSAGGTCVVICEVT